MGSLSYEPPMIAELGTLHDRTLGTIIHASNPFATAMATVQADGLTFHVSAVQGDSGASVNFAPGSFSANAHKGSIFASFHFPW